MGQPEGTVQAAQADSRTPVWFTTLAALLALAAAASWLTSARSAIHHAIFEARLREAAQFEEARDPSGAAAEYRHALEIHFDSFPARLGLARCLAQLGRWPEATKHLLELSADFPDSGPVHLLAARAAIQAHDTQSATNFYRRSVYGYWTPAEAAQRLAAQFEWVRWLDAQGRPDALFPELVRLQQELPPGDPHLAELAGLYQRAGHPDEAAATYRLALARDRNNALLWSGLGRAELALFHIAEAHRAFSNAVAAPAVAATQADTAGPSEAATLRDLTGEALRLDPTARRLAPAERDARTSRLLLRTRQHLDACSASLNASARAQAATELARPTPRPAAGRLELAESLWQSARRLCPPLSPTESPLPLVFGALAGLPQ